MEKLIFVFVGFLLAAIILCLLALAIRRYRNQKTAEVMEQIQQIPVKPPEPSPAKETQQAPEQVVPTAAPTAAATSSQSLDEVIQSAFRSLEEGAYQQATKSFQEGLRMTDDTKISVRLYLELAKIHNIFGDQKKALKDLDSALELCRKSKNGATEQELLNIRQMISS